MKIKQLLFATLVLGVATGASAQMKPEDQIKFRKAGYAFMSWNMGKIKAQTIDNPSSFNKDQVLAAATVIAATANSGMGALYGAGTDKDAGNQKTRVKPEFFQQQDAAADGVVVHQVLPQGGDRHRGKDQRQDNIGEDTAQQQLSQRKKTRATRFRPAHARVSAC